jgi:hypothetical protein
MSIVVGGGLDGPFRGLPRESIARAKPALERGHFDRLFWL